MRKVLIANRGEIACRIARTCRRLGIGVATIHSSADRSARHVREIGESIEVGGAPAAESYLNIDAVLAAARRVGADAVRRVPVLTAMRQVLIADRGEPPRSGAATKSHRVARAACAGELAARAAR